MKIVMIPGKRDERKIEEVREIKSQASPDEWEDYLIECVAQDETYMDALYYADERKGKQALKEQARYFHDLLVDDERYYFVSRLGKTETDL